MARKTVLVNLDNPFSKFFTGLWDIKTKLDSLLVYRGCTVENWSAQSVSNRATASHLTTVEVKFSDSPKVTVKLARGWLPARIGTPGYNGEPIGGKAKAENTWSKYRSADIKPVNLPREAAAIIGYCVDNLYTGAMISGESVFKAKALKLALDTLKPESLTVTLLQDETTQYKNPVSKTWEIVDGFKNQVVLSLPEIEAILVAMSPRLTLADSVPIEPNITVKKGSRAGMVDI